MNKLITTIALVLAVCFGVSFDASAAVTTPVAGVARAGATGDILLKSSFGGYGIVTVKSIKVNPIAGGKYFRLRKGTVSGDIIYETNSSATTGTMTADVVKFDVPSDGLYFQTNDTGSIIVYTD